MKKYDAWFKKGNLFFPFLQFEIKDIIKRISPYLSFAGVSLLAFSGKNEESASFLKRNSPVLSLWWFGKSSVRLLKPVLKTNQTTQLNHSKS